MKKPSCILVPVDCSDCSLEALDLGASMAAEMDARLVVLRVAERAGPGRDAADCGVAANLRSLFNDRFRTYISSAPWEDGKTPKVAVRRGKVVDEILKAAEEENADMLVMGTHGRKGMRRAILGSVAEQVIRSAPCMVLVVRSGARSLANA